MILLRCFASPTWRHIGQVLTKPFIRHETTTTTTKSVFSNVQKSLTHNVLVFEYKDRVLPLLGAIGLVQFIALDFVAYWSFHLFGTVTARQETLTSDSTILERAATIVPTNRFRYTTNLIIVLLSKSFGNNIVFLSFLISRWCYIWCLFNLSRTMYTPSLSTQGWFVNRSCHICIMA